ncbi:BolA family protein [Candidatus Providencia siddallii]|uniref:Acid stress protein IbaG n=1 Tax=Candidatus Providencia siddallii TaxID=1715285 RepID=A0ABP1CI35_9GAMM
MKPDEIKQILMKKISLNDVIVTCDFNHFKIIAISDIFKNMNNVKRQQIIYFPLIDYIKNNIIHSVSIKTYTIEEWNNNHKFK